MSATSVLLSGLFSIKNNAKLVHAHVYKN